MKAIFVKEPKSLEIVDLPEPVVKAGEVLVRVRAAGICGSDMHIYHGTNPLAKYPRVIGHEFAGEVVAVGGGVNSPKIGDHVAVDPVTACGACYPCSIGRPNVCTKLEVFGVHRDGGMAEFVAVPSRNAHIAPKDWPFEKLVMTEPFSIAANTLSRSECTSRDLVLVMGAGPIGLTILMGAKLLGARVAVADILDSRLKVAKDLGAELAINSKNQDLEREMNKWTDGVGVPLVIDAVCIPELFAQLLRIASPAGRVAHLSFSEKPTMISSLEVTKKELAIIGSRLNCNMFPRVIDWFGKGLEPEKLVSHKFSFTEVVAAFRLIEEKPLETCKVLLTF
ncbi:putative zinc-type alcohol dehydrogenase-like protein YjmD [Synergistales bacterium]|nr:putative zinc-type alcohol dehydrogenase-like protein YjmD [Synergistales bacterium]